MNRYLITLLSCFLAAFTAQATNIKSLVLFYDEVEQGVGSQTMRYIINKDYLRVDNGDDKGDFILFDVRQKTIYSINHEDQTILKIENHPWTLPELDFEVKVKQQVMQNAPKISNQQVYSYLVNADEITCTQVSLVKGMFAEYLPIFYKYQQVLSGQQVATLNNTPKDFHTPCFLIDQIYHSGGYYKVGLPVHISYSRGYEKFLKDFKENAFESELFIKPEEYTEYSAAF